MNIEGIRRGLAANLRAVEDCVVSPYLIEDPLKPALQVAGFEEINYAQVFGPGATIGVVIEGVAGAAVNRAAWALFDQWILWEVPEAIEADTQLTSRLQDSGSILTGQDPACDSLAVREFRGYRKTLIKGNEVLLGEWVVDLLVSD